MAAVVGWLLVVTFVVFDPVPNAAVGETVPTVGVVDPGPLPATPAPPVAMAPSGDFGLIDEWQPVGLLPESAEALEAKRVVMRSANMTAFDNGDGTSVAIVGAGPMNWQDSAKRWRAIDPRLSDDGTGVIRSASGPLQVSLVPASRSDGIRMVTVAGEGWLADVGVTGLSAGVPLTTTETKGTWSGVAPGLDLVAESFGIV